MSKLRCIVLSLTLYCANGHIAYWNSPNHLHPVQGLYVKPSVDGTTGDLYVAASEDSGVKTQWLTDQPINFLPAAGAHQSAPWGVSLPHDETLVNTQKRAAVTSPAFQYAYAFPGVPSEVSTIPYPYAIPATNPSACLTEGVPECVDTPAPTYTQYSPYQYYYPQMVAAYSKAINAMKESGMSEEMVSAIMSQSAPMWPQTYAYPVQYMMVDPTKWAQSQAVSPGPTTPPTTSTPTTSEETD